jgi:hypothetical protein
VYERVSQTADACQLLLHDGRFVLELQCVGDVLPLATAAHAKVFATRRDTLRRWRDELRDTPTRETSFVFDDLNFGYIVGHRKRHKDRLAIVSRERIAAEDDMLESDSHRGSQ